MVPSLVLLIVFGVHGLVAASEPNGPLAIGGYVFTEGSSAFADDAFLVSGTIRFTCATANAGPASSVAEALAGHNLERCVNNNTGNSGIVESLFNDNSIENGAGPDLVIFELSGALPAGTPEPRERFGVSLEGPSGFTPFTYFDPIATGTNSCGDPTICLDTFSVEIDLSDFGMSPGTLVDRVQLHIFDVGLGTKSGDVAALGALNSTGPLPFEDSDADGVEDFEDNCPFVPNGSMEPLGAPSWGGQAESPQFAGVGCACLCGDPNRDCFITVADGPEAQRAGLTPPLAPLSPLFDVEFCDLNGDGICNVGDAPEMQRAGLLPPLPPLSPNFSVTGCSGYLGP